MERLRAEDGISLHTSASVLLSLTVDPVLLLCDAACIIKDEFTRNVHDAYAQTLRYRSISDLYNLFILHLFDTQILERVRVSFHFRVYKSAAAKKVGHVEPERLYRRRKLLNRSSSLSPFSPRTHHSAASETHPSISALLTDPPLYHPSHVLSSSSVLHPLPLSRGGCRGRSQI